MYKKVALVLWLCLLTTCAAQAALEVSWQEGEEYFPSREKWTYVYRWRMPQLAGESKAAGEINYYFETARREMTDLVVPMYAADPDMAASGGNVIEQRYEVTCNSGRFFSTLLKQRQVLGQKTILSLSSQVFATSGEYEGQTLTLRGLVMVGDSSVQLADAVLADVFTRVKAQMAGQPGPWKQDLTQEALAEDFFPETHFYADEGGNAVFYLQPGLARNDDQVLTFPYSPAQLQALLKS